MNPTSEFSTFVKNAIDHLKEDLKSIRTGHATPALVENIPVTTYGGSTTLRLLEISSITTEGPSTIIIIPFDQSTIGDIEKEVDTISQESAEQMQTIKDVKEKEIMTI